MRGIRDRRWNSERFIVFQTVTLHRARHVTASRNIRRRIEKRLDVWEAGRYGMLVEDTLRSSTQYLTAVHREETVEHRAKTFHGMVLRSKLWTTVRWITEREKGGYCSQRSNAQRRGNACCRCSSQNTLTHDHPSLCISTQGARPPPFHAP